MDRLGEDVIDNGKAFHIFSPLKSIVNRPFPSCFELYYESEAKYKVFVMQISFHSCANKTNFLMKSFALSLASIVRFTATQKWPIMLDISSAGVFYLSSHAGHPVGRITDICNQYCK